MKICASFVLFLFLSIITLPTIVLVFDNDKTNVTIIFNISEEEEVHKSLYPKANYTSNKVDGSIHNKQLTSQNTIFKKSHYYDSFMEEIYAPPPEI